MIQLKIMQSEENARFLEENCGYKPVIVYDEEKHGRFSGDTISLAVAQVNDQTGTVEKNFMAENASVKDPDAMLQQLLDNASDESNPDRIRLTPCHITQFNKNTKSLVHKTIWMMPYRVIGHSSEMPTVMSNIYGSCNTSENVTVELLLVEANNPTIHRYLTVKFKTSNVYMIDLVKGAFEECTYEYIPDELKEAGMTYMDDTTEEESGFCITFYDDCGNPYNIIHSDGEDFLRYIVSMRMIDIKHHIDAL